MAAKLRERRIREARPRDAEKICALHKASIRELCCEAYSPEEIAAWIEPFAPDLYLPLMDRFDFFVAEEKKIIGFCIFDLEVAELNAIYVHPRAVRQGVGSQLVTLVERAARDEGLPRLRVKATLNSLPFYNACGFTRDRDATDTGRSGLQVPCVEMVKDVSVDAQAD